MVASTLWWYLMLFPATPASFLSATGQVPTERGSQTAAPAPSEPVQCLEAGGSIDDGPPRAGPSPPVSVSLVAYNVLFSTAWDPEHEANIRPATEASPASFAHFLSKYREMDWEADFGIDESVPPKSAGGAVSAKPLRFASAVPQNWLEDGSSGSVDEDNFRAKFQKYAELFGQKQRLQRLMDKLEKTMREDGRPIVALSEVTLKWATALAEFFSTQNYVVHYAPGSEPKHNFFGLLLAYPRERRLWGVGWMGGRVGSRGFREIMDGVGGWFLGFREIMDWEVIVLGGAVLLRKLASRNTRQLKMR